MYMYGFLMYIFPVSTYSMAEARNHFADLIDEAQTQAVVIERRGKRAAVMLSPDYYEQLLEALEDAQDVAAFDEAIAEEGPNIPWDQVKIDLGWT